MGKPQTFNPDTYAALLPPLSTAEFEALAADIAEHGVRDAIAVDELGNILDGRHRYLISPNCPHRVIKGLSEDEKQAFTIRANMARRNLSPDQKREVAARQKQIAKSLRESDPKRWTQEAVARVLGVDRTTVSKWWGDTTNVNVHNGCIPKPDARVKVPAAAKQEIARRVDAGETQAQVAADYGVTQQAVAKIAQQAEVLHARDDDKARKTAKLAGKVFDLRQGDFRDVLSDVEGVSLILTDPPYPKESLPLWEELAKWASRALADDGILVAYSGQMYLPIVLELLSRHLDYWWCGAVVHKGSGNLTPLGFPVRKVINGWKPLVMFYKPGGHGVSHTYRDLIEGAGADKSHHNWQQNELEAQAIIEAFTKPGELVVDPFAGSGGFCRAAERLGRVAIGAEIL